MFVRLLVFGIALFGWSVELKSQNTPMKADICEVAKNPEPFSGKLIELSGDVNSSFEQFTLTGRCKDTSLAVWLSFPDGVEPESRPDFRLEKDNIEELFEEALKAQGGGLLHRAERPANLKISATLVGRLDGPGRLITRNEKGEKIVRNGLGHLNAYSLRLVIRSVEVLTLSRQR